MDRRKFLGGLGAAVVATVLPKPVRAEEYFEKLKAETEANNLPVAMADGVDANATMTSYTTASTSLAEIYGPPIPNKLRESFLTDQEFMDMMSYGRKK